MKFDSSPVAVLTPVYNGEPFLQECIEQDAMLSASGKCNGGLAQLTNGTA